MLVTLLAVIPYNHIFLFHTPKKTLFKKTGSFSFLRNRNFVRDLGSEHQNVSCETFLKIFVVSL